MLLGADGESGASRPRGCDGSLGLGKLTIQFIDALPARDKARGMAIAHLAADPVKAAAEQVSAVIAREVLGEERNKAAAGG